MFDFLFMGSYESRKVGRWDSEDGERMVSTAEVNDGSHPYETAFMHPEYNDGKMVIVEAYDTRQEAEVGHERWQKVMTDGPLPDELKDCCNAQVGQLYEAVGGDVIFKRAPPRSVPSEE